MYRTILHQIIGYLYEREKEGVPGTIFFHCFGGADRTGTVAFLVEALLGVSESDMSKDYELTTYSSSRVGDRLRTDTGSRPYKLMIEYLRNNFPGSDMQEIVTNWATTGSNALSYEEIDLLKDLMLE